MLARLTGRDAVSARQLALETGLCQQTLSRARAEKCAVGAGLTMPLRLGLFVRRRPIGWSAR
jgi:hypothetical protein